MNFQLKDEHRLIQKVVRDFAKTEVEPVAAENDELQRFPADLVERMAAMNLIGMPVPREYGGAGTDHISYVIAVEELSAVDASTGGIVTALTSLVCYPLFRYGNEEQRQKYLRPLCEGKKLGAFALTETGAGSDAINQQTVALDCDDYFLLNGNKIFISGGDVADFVIVFCQVVKKAGKRGRISALIVEKGMEGFTLGTKENKLGIRASGTCELVFTDVKVPRENLLGEIGEGFAIAMDTLDGGRIGVGAQALGIARGAYEASVKYAKERKQFGQAICKFQAIQWMLADMATEIDAARLLVHRAADMKDRGLDISSAAAMAKLYASEAAMKITTKAIQIHGGYGYMKDYPVERYFRDAKITEIYEGTSEVQRMVIASELLKK